MNSDVHQESHGAWLDKAQREALEFAGIGVYRFTFDGVLVFLDSGAMRIFDLAERFSTPEAIAGRRLADLIEYTEPVGNTRTEVRRLKSLRDRPWSFRTHKGKVKYVLEDAYLVIDPRTDEESVQVVMRDVTAQRRMEDALRVSEQRYRETLENMQLAAVQLDIAGRVTYCNKYLLGVTGYTWSEVMGGAWIDLFLPPEWRDTIQGTFFRGEVGEAHLTTHYENPILTRNGELRHFLWSNTLVRNSHGVPAGYTAIGQDITVRRMAEEALRESEEKYRTLVEMFPFCVAIFQNGQTVFVNKTSRSMLGLNSLDDVVGKDSLQMIAPEERDRLETFTRRRLEGDPTVPYHYETRMRRMSGETFPAEVYVRPITYRGAPAVQVLALDITERIEAEAAVRESECKYRNVLESMHEGYYEVNLEGRITFFNRALCHLLGYTPEEMLGLSYTALYADETAAQHAYDAYEKAYRAGADAQLFDWEMYRKDGSKAIFEVSISLMRNGDGAAPTGFCGMLRDVTERTYAEDALREAEARYRELFENANDIVYTHDLEGNFTSLNKVGEQISGYTRDQAMQLNVEDVIAPEYQERVQKMRLKKHEAQETTRYEAAVLTKQGARLPVEISTRLIYKDGKPIGVQGIARDITERKHAEAEQQRLKAQIQHTQKLESLGVLAGGIAHDFNNLLVGVLGNAGLALERLPEDTPAHTYVQKIGTAAQRAADLTNQMLAYAGKGAIVPRPLDLSKLAREMGELLSASVAKNAELVFECAGDLPPIEGDDPQLHQVILNLVINASEAIGDKPGTVTVRTYAQYLDGGFGQEAYLDEHLPPGDYVCLEVRDTGCGMDAETQSRIFDPFFSTKFTGRGLGLASALGIVRGHGGAVALESAPGQGTAFRVYFPAKGVRKPLHGGEVSPTSADDLRTWRTSGTVLVVDDEETVCAVAQETLHTIGFETVTAPDGRQGLDLFLREPGRYTAVIMDLMMPVMNGAEAIREIRRIRPNMPIVLSSGYTKEDAAGQVPETPRIAFVHKPYAPSDLARALRSLLEPGHA
ncbi:MAG: PAS domain S-box protein [Candidatus Hydrogenedentota bacterium]